MGRTLFGCPIAPGLPRVAILERGLRLAPSADDAPIDAGMSARSRFSSTERADGFVLLGDMVVPSLRCLR